MKCPIIVREIQEKGELIAFQQGDCLKADCAWWDKDIARCGIRSIELTLHAIETAQTSIAHRSPPAPSTRS
jgi:hypothetical protein